MKKLSLKKTLGTIAFLVSQYIVIYSITKKPELIESILTWEVVLIVLLLGIKTASGLIKEFLGVPKDE